MRVLHIVTSLDPAFGGISEFVATLLRNQPAGVRSEAVTMDDPAAGYLAGMEVHALGPVATIYGKNPRLIPWLRAHRGEYDGVILHGLWQYGGLAVLRTISQHPPYLVFPHGMLDPYFKHESLAKHMKKWAYWLLVEYWVLRRAKRVLFTTQAESDLARKSFGLHRWQAEVVPFGTIGPPADAKVQVEAFWQMQPQLRGRRFVLFLGRIHRKKGCDLLVEAFAREAAGDPELDLVMAGPDQQGWALELKTVAAAAGIADRIHWTGMLAGEAKWGALRAAEVFVLPSHQENFGIAVAEALACGTPVLLSDKVNIAGDISLDEAGFVAPDTLEGTEALLRRWVRTPADERAEMRLNAVACFGLRYDLGKNTMAILDLFGTK